MGRLAGAIAVVALLVVGGLYFHQVGKIENQLENLARQLDPLGWLSWDRVVIDPRGQVRIDRLEFTARQGRDTISTDRVELHAQNLFALLSIGRELEAGRLPESLGLRVRGLSIPVDSALAAPLGTAFLPGLPFPGAGCGDYDPFEFSDLAELDYWSVALDLSLDYRFADQDRDLELTLSSRMPQLGDFWSQALIALETPTRSLIELQPQIDSLRLRAASLEYLDLGYYPRLTEFCASHRDLDEAEWRQAHLDAWNARWQARGLEPHRHVQGGYAHFLDTPESVRIEILPEAPVSLATQEISRLADSDLGATFAINEGTKMALRFVPGVDPPDEQTRQAEPGTRSTTDTEPAADRHLPTRPEQLDEIHLGPLPSWREIEIGQAESFTGYQAIIHHHDGSRLRGRIDAVDEGQLHLRIRTSGGEFVRPIAFETVARIEVRR